MSAARVHTCVPDMPSERQRVSSIMEKVNALITLTGNGLERSTRQRDAIQTVMEQAARPLTPQELLDAAKKQVSSISIATVYRNIKSLVESGEVVTVELPGEAARYELASSHHHHHFHCRSCDRVFEVLECPGDMKRLAPYGFQVESHELILYGLCADCRSRAHN